MVAFSPAFSFHGQVNFAGNWGANVIGRYSPYTKYLPRYFDQPLIKEPCIRPSLKRLSQVLIRSPYYKSLKTVGLENALLRYRTKKKLQQ